MLIYPIQLIKAINMKKIGLFPLDIVLFPESIYPLHIFEERYRQLINHCHQNNLEFGICPIANSKMRQIGCKAKVVEITSRHEDGKMDILVKGTERFRLVNFTEGAKPYYIGNLEPYMDEPEIADFGLADQCVELFNNIAREIKGVFIEEIEINSIQANKLSFLIAQKTGLPYEKKIELIELRSENARLRKLKSHLRLILPAIKTAEQVNRIIRNDGYFRLKRI